MGGFLTLFVEEILPTFAIGATGGGVGALAVAWFVKRGIEFTLGKRLEHYKSELAKEVAAHSIVYREVHLSRTKTVNELWNSIQTAHDAARNYVTGDWDDPDGAACEIAWREWNECNEVLRRGIITLTDKCFEAARTELAVLMRCLHSHKRCLQLRDHPHESRATLRLAAAIEAEEKTYEAVKSAFREAIQ